MTGLRNKVRLVGPAWVGRRGQELGLPGNRETIARRLAAVLPPYYTDEERLAYGIPVRVWRMQDAETALRMLAWRPKAKQEGGEDGR